MGFGIVISPASKIESRWQAGNFEVENDVKDP
jgi:hypothetical protein